MFCHSNAIIKYDLHVSCFTRYRYGQASLEIHGVPKTEPDAPTEMLPCMCATDILLISFDYYNYNLQNRLSFKFLLLWGLVQCLDSKKYMVFEPFSMFF